MPGPEDPEGLAGLSPKDREMMEIKTPEGSRDSKYAKLAELAEAVEKMSTLELKRKLVEANRDIKMSQQFNTDYAKKGLQRAQWTKSLIEARLAGLAETGPAEGSLEAELNRLTVDELRQKHSETVRSMEENKDVVRNSWVKDMIEARLDELANETPLGAAVEKMSVEELRAQLSQDTEENEERIDGLLNDVETLRDATEPRSNGIEPNLKR